MVDEKENPLKLMKEFEPITIKDMIESRNFSVPLNQRKFSWDTDYINDVWDDLIEIIKSNINITDNKNYHFFGPMFFIPDDKRNYTILDGQQRLASITILLSVIRDMIYYSNDKIYSDPICLRTLIDGFIQRRDETNIKLNLGNPILILGEKNKDYFKNLIQKIEFPYQKISSKPDEHPSNQLIKKAYKTFLRNIYLYLNDKSRDEEFDLKKENIIEELKEILKTEKAKNKLLDLFNSVLGNFYILKIEVDTPVKAYKIFETLNDRGVKLAIADLFRNILFIKIKDKDDIAKANGILNEISSLETMIRMDIFLRHYWMANFGFARQKDLFDEISKEIEKYDAKKIIEFLEDILEFAKVYAKFVEPTIAGWNGQKDIVELLDVLNRLNVVIIRPLLYKSFTEWGIKGLREVLETSVDLFFRNTISDVSASKYETKYTELCTDIRNKSKKSVNDITEELKQIIPRDKKFEEGFEKRIISTNKLARYIIGNINDTLLGKGGSVTDPKITLEHIIPETLDREHWWEKHLNSKNLEHEDLVSRLGNFTLLTEEENNSIQNSSYPEKYKVYSKSILPVNKDLKKFSDWDDKTILEREQYFAKIAIKQGIWGNYN
jgi:uncharacterized protein with ParB-like and HNH nuclease domain